MIEPIESEYFNWLCAKVLALGNNNYIALMRILYNTPFTWIVPGDRNRADDGCELRIYFLRESTWEKDPRWFDEPCSVLEMLIAFSKRAAFQTDIPNYEWFITFLINLNLERYRRVSRSDEPVIEDILNTFIWRTYDRSGYGGLFPMRRPKHDQRQVEIWFQFFEYIEEQGLG